MQTSRTRWTRLVLAFHEGAVVQVFSRAVVPVLISLFLISYSPSLSHGAGVTKSATQAPQGSGPSPTPTTSWIVPAPGSYLCGTATLLMESAGLSPAQITPTTVFQYSRDGRIFTTIGNAYYDSGLIEGAWDTSAVDTGSYFLRLFSRGPSSLGTSRPIRIQVNREPVAAASLLSIQEPQNIVTLDASVSSDLDGSIVKYIWEFGDGSPPESSDVPIVVHHYPGDGIYGVSLTVVDNAGCSSIAHYVLNCGQEGMLHEKRDCGCKKMRLERSGKIEGGDDIYFNKYIANEKAQHELGPYVASDGTFIDIYMRFEVIVELKEFCDPKHCKEGQRVQATHTYGNPAKDYPGKKGPVSTDPVVTPPPNAEPIECLYGGEKWCDDGFHVERPGKGFGWFWKKHDPAQKFIWWIDPPGIANLKVSDLPFSAKIKFHAKVEGARGTCECTWDVIMKDVNINAAGKVTGTIEIPENSVKCTH